MSIDGKRIQCDTLDDLYSFFVRLGYLEVITYLIEVQGYSAGYTGRGGQTLLHHACR